jgi:hypothetical protein
MTMTFGLKSHASSLVLQPMLIIFLAVVFWSQNGLAFQLSCQTELSAAGQQRLSIPSKTTTLLSAKAPAPRPIPALGNLPQERPIGMTTLVVPQQQQQQQQGVPLQDSSTTLAERQEEATAMVQALTLHLSRMAKDAVVLQDQVQHMTTLQQAGEKKHVQQLEQELEEAFKARVHLQRQLNDLMLEYERLWLERKQLEQDMQLLDDEALGTFRLLQAQEKEATQLQQQLNVTRSEQHKLQREIAVMLQEQDTLWSQKDELEQKAEFMHQQNLIIHNQFKTQEKRATEMEQELARISKEHDKEREQWESLMASKDRQLESMRVQLDTLQQARPPNRTLQPGSIPTFEIPRSDGKSKPDFEAVPRKSPVEETKRRPADWMTDKTNAGHRATP